MTKPFISKGFQTNPYKEWEKQYEGGESIYLHTNILIIGGDKRKLWEKHVRMKQKFVIKHFICQE